MDVVPLLIRNYDGRTTGKIYIFFFYFKIIVFTIDIISNQKMRHFLDITLSRNNGFYKPYIEPNHNLIYTNKNSNQRVSYLNRYK